MKAEERHRLQQNALRTGLNKLATETKSASSTFWGVLLLVVVVVVCYFWWTHNTSRAISASWVHYWESRSAAERLDFTPTDELEKTMNNFSTKSPAQVAKLTFADEMYEKGFQTMFRKSPADAASNFTEAGKVYEELATAGGVPVDVTARALLGAGVCQESMGDVERAKHFYNELLDRYGGDKSSESTRPSVVEARRRKQELESKDGMAFYGSGQDRAAWPKRLPAVNRSTKPPEKPAGEALPDVPPLPPTPPVSPAEKNDTTPAKPASGADTPAKPTDTPAKPDASKTDAVPKPPEKPQ